MCSSLWSLIRHSLVYYSHGYSLIFGQYRRSLDRGVCIFMRNLKMESSNKKGDQQMKSLHGIRGCNFFLGIVSFWWLNNYPFVINVKGGEKLEFPSMTKGEIDEYGCHWWPTINDKEII